MCVKHPFFERWLGSGCYSASEQAGYLLFDPIERRERDAGEVRAFADEEPGDRHDLATRITNDGCQEQGDSDED